MAGNIVKEKIIAGARIIDVRTPAEYKDGAYPGGSQHPSLHTPRQNERAEAPGQAHRALLCIGGAQRARGAAAQAGRLHRRDQRRRP